MKISFAVGGGLRIEGLLKARRWGRFAHQPSADRPYASATTPAVYQFPWRLRSTKFLFKELPFRTTHTRATNYLSTPKTRATK